MRIFLLLLLLAWVVGIAVGTYSGAIWVVLTTSVVLLTLTWLIDRRSSLLLASVVLVWLGAAYALESGTIAKSCDLGSQTVIVVEQ